MNGRSFPEAGRTGWVSTPVYGFRCSSPVGLLHIVSAPPDWYDQLAATRSGAKPCSGAGPDQLLVPPNSHNKASIMGTMSGKPTGDEQRKPYTGVLTRPVLPSSGKERPCIPRLKTEGSSFSFPVTFAR